MGSPRKRMASLCLALVLTAGSFLLPAGIPASAALPTAAMPTKTTRVPLRVATFNVRCANCYAHKANELPWAKRRDAVVGAIKAQAPDVIGLQEASQGWLKDAKGKLINLAQFEDLVARLGQPYALANGARNNCVKPSTPTKCVAKYQGASKGTKIVYNTRSLKLVRQGAQLLPGTKGDGGHYVAWAVFTQKATGKQFLFADTQLTPGATAAATRVRAAQTKKLVETIKKQNPGHLPVYVVGDFNSTKWRLPSNAPYDIMRKAGFVDPLGNTYRSTKKTSGASVKTRIHTDLNSYTGFARRAPRSSYINGSYLDYIWTSPGIAVSEWQTVAKLDKSGKFIGVIPSDHNMLRATTYLP